ncbi:hypothetical protein OB955_15460 [Halobacteria archaeon AArc-m2/3/4]|uniref:DUF7344 domain-containing protein n=1 Tax=Natronoglomus mannanivorans TaxID=2979990 RepID=A0ABT2QGT4_9EURY|nr:hypothetical protein [Halobacteria archaeon AArc-m2/3/4]
MSRDSTEFDAVLDLCRDHHRRIVLAVLAEERRPLTMNDLSKAILKYNHSTPVTEVSEEVLTEIRLSLYHEHIPKLESEEIIEYDPERQHVVPTERFDQLRPSLSVIIEVDPDLQVPVEL